MENTGKKVELYRCQPIASQYVKHCWPSLVFGVPFSVFVIIISVKGYEIFPRPTIFLFIGPFIIIALYLLIAPIRYWVRSKSIEYVVSDTKAMIFKSSKLIKEYAFDEIDLTRARYHPDGSGHIWIGGTNPSDSYGGSEQSRGFVEQMDKGFFGVPDMRKFVELVNEYE